MTTRITEFETIRRLLYAVQQNRQTVDKLGNAISSGIAVKDPSDSTQSGTIAQVQEAIQRADGHKNRITSAQSFLSFQDNALKQANDLLVRASEIATQAANASNTTVSREQLSEEVFQIRDHLVSLANSTYQGKYVWAGANDLTPPYSKTTYTEAPPSGEAADRYVFDSNPGDLLTRDVKITDDLSVRVNTPGNQVFDNGIQALERLGRALAGYKTNPSVGAPDGTGQAYDFPTETLQQTQDIQNSLNLLKSSRENDIIPEVVSVAGRMRRLDTASSLLDLSKTSNKEVLSKLQDTDVIEASAQFSIAQTALQSAMAVTAKVLGQSILDYL